MAVDGAELLPHAAWNTTVPNPTTKHTPNRHWRRRELVPAPSSAKPETGSSNAYHSPFALRSEVVLTGRAVVEMVSVELAGLVLVSVSVLVEKVQVAWVGNPEAHDSETLLGNVGIGVTVT